MSDRETIGVYDARAAEYARIVGTGAPDETLRAFIAALPEGALVLDLGCGPGVSAGHMARAGCVVEAWDASAAMVALAARVPGIAARQAVFDDLDAEARFDGIWANFSLLHAPLADIPRHLAAIRRALKPGGLFHIAVKEGAGERRDSLGRQYSYFTEAGLAAYLSEAGLVPGPFRRGMDRGLSGSVDPWISVTAHA